MSEYQLYHNDENEFLWKLLADPVNNTHLYTYNLQRLVNDNPQSGIFRALLARTGGEENFKLASVHFNSKSLYKLINYPSGFEKVTADKIILDDGIPSRPQDVKPVNEIQDYVVDEPEVNLSYENNGETRAPTFTGEEKVESQPGQVLADKEAIAVETPAETTEAVKENEHIMEVSMAAEYDITTGYDVSKPGVFGSDVSIAQLREELKNIKAGVAKPVETGNEIVPISKDNKAAIYIDNSTPYSFMWWLNNTRNEQADSFQPYARGKIIVTAKPKTAVVDELQHQYIENIFHLTSVEELEKSTADKPITWDFNRKESQIIERFLAKEPQIQPQQGDKLDNENKAKQSSEDANEIVTETLAAIYAEQMLYQKSIAAYKKLMLRFPEKSRYFADKIEVLEKKTNL